MVKESELSPAARRRLRRERETVAAMIRMHCADLHGGKDALCPDCQGLLDYAEDRVDHCVFRDDKPTCAHCPVHCYKPDRREQIRGVMRHSGPRMLTRHPLLAVLHLVDGRRPPPADPRRRARP